MLRAREHERRLEARANSTSSAERRRWLRSRIQAVTRPEIPSRQETLEVAERLARRAGSSSPPPATLIPTLRQSSPQTSFARPNGVAQPLAIDPALTLLETGVPSSHVPRASSHMTSMSSDHNIEPMFEDFRSVRAPQRQSASPGEVFGRYLQQPPRSPVTRSFNITIPPRFYGRATELRFSGPDGHSILFPARIEPDCDVAQVPGEFAIRLGWAFRQPGTRRQIFECKDGRVSNSSLGRGIPEWLIRGFGIHVTPYSMEPELEVDICLASTPDYTAYPYSPSVDLSEVRPYWYAPYVVISRPLLIKMLERGYDLPDLAI